MVTITDLRVTLLQADLFWEDKKANLDQFSQKLDRLSTEYRFDYPARNVYNRVQYAAGKAG